MSLFHPHHSACVARECARMEQQLGEEKKESLAKSKICRGFCISQRQTYFRVFFRMTGGKRLTYVMRLEMSLLRDPTIVCKLRKACSSYMCETMEICEEKNFSRIEYRRFRIFLRCVIFRNFF